ncbi:unnamed protein product, partial [Prorocentrum cordatum]
STAPAAWREIDAVLGSEPGQQVLGALPSDGFVYPFISGNPQVATVARGRELAPRARDNALMA